MLEIFANRQLVLASASPRRLDILRTIGLDPVVAPRPCAESMKLDARGPGTLVKINAVRKAHATAPEFADALVLGADTLVVLEGRLLGKPADAREAAQMLRQLAGRLHSVHTGICLIDTKSGKEVAGHQATQVRFCDLTEKQIADYVAGGEPLDKAGAYGIQGAGGLFVEEIRGDYGTVVGLSLPLLRRLAQELKDGTKTVQPWLHSCTPSP